MDGMAAATAHGNMFHAGAAQNCIALACALSATEELAEEELAMTSPVAPAAMRRGGPTVAAAAMRRGGSDAMRRPKGDNGPGHAEPHALKQEPSREAGTGVGGVARGVADARFGLPDETSLALAVSVEEPCRTELVALALEEPRRTELVSG